MANRRIEFTKEQVRELQAAMKKNKHKNIERRLCVVWMKKEKKSIAEIVARTGYSQSHARAIITKYFKEGISAITENKYKGNHRNISYEEEKAFVESFKERVNEGEYTTVKDIKKNMRNLLDTVSEVGIFIRFLSVINVEKSSQDQCIPTKHQRQK